MTKSESVIRSILGAVRVDIRPLAFAVDTAVDLKIVCSGHTDGRNIFVTDDIYPEAAEHFRKRSGEASTPKAVARRIERLSNLCWDTIVSRELVMDYIGAQIKDIRAPRDIIFYLAFYVYFDIPFFTVIVKQPALLF